MELERTSFVDTGLKSLGVAVRSSDLLATGASGWGSAGKAASNVVATTVAYGATAAGHSKLAYLRGLGVVRATAAADSGPELESRMPFRCLLASLALPASKPSYENRLRSKGCCRPQKRHDGVDAVEDVSIAADWATQSGSFVAGAGRLAAPFD